MNANSHPKTDPAVPAASKGFPRSLTLGLSALTLLSAQAADRPSTAWYREGNFAPKTRIEIRVTNPLDIDRPDCPVVIPRAMLPVQDIHEMALSVVDPSQPGRPAPDRALLARQGGHLMLEESNGRQLGRQLDDLDKDGVWDELFFQLDLAARESRTLYLYLGFSQRGWLEHGTHAALGSYCRHLMPFWESKHIGWKLWYPTDVDMFGKRTPRLMSPSLYIENLNGYGVPHPDGSDIQTVSGSFGAGGIGLFENPADPADISRPRFTSAPDRENANWNTGWLNDTRYAYDVVANGPMRSMVRIRTMNWRTGKGEYGVEQIYTAYTNQSFSTCRVRFTRFNPAESGVMFGCGIRKNTHEYDWMQEGGTVITIGDEAISDPDDTGDGARSLTVKFVGNALVVKDVYRPAYQFVPTREGNHTFRVPPTADLGFEYLIAGAWSEGAVHNTPESFKQYVRDVARGFNHPPVVTVNADIQNAAN